MHKKKLGSESLIGQDQGAHHRLRSCRAQVEAPASGYVWPENLTLRDQTPTSRHLPLALVSGRAHVRPLSRAISDSPRLAAALGRFLDPDPVPRGFAAPCDYYRVAKVGGRAPAPPARGVIVVSRVRIAVGMVAIS